MTYIYVIGREEGPVKVGISDNPYGRLGQIRTACPYRVELLFTHKFSNREEARREERDFHAVYEEHRMAGEWFDLHSELAIEGVETGIEFAAYFAARARGEVA